MSGAILNCLNTRLEKRSIEFILKHSKSKILIFHEDYISLVKSLSKKYKIKLLIVQERAKINYPSIQKSIFFSQKNF